jgi:hypothetical protein
MRTATALLLFCALIISLGPVIQPAAGAVAQSVKASCCVKMEAGQEQSDCGQQKPKSKEDRQCCAACTLGLALYFDRPARLLAPSAREEIFTALILQSRSRSERPPTPPPRRFFS